MRARKKGRIKKKYYFEAELFPASIPLALSKYEPELNQIDLTNILAPQSKNIYLVKVNGESMIDENIYDGDILIVDKNEVPKDGSIVIAALNGELTVKTFRLIEGKPYLFSANKKFLPIEIGELMQFEIQGVVKHVIKNLI